MKDIQGTDTADQHLGEGSRDATAACTGEEASRRKARMISLKQRKRNDDPALLDWRLAAQGQESPCTALVQVAGALVGALCLHHSLVELAPALEEECAQKSVDGPESVNAHGGLTHDSAPIVLRDVARFLPFEHLFKTSEALRLALENESAGDGDAIYS